MKNKIIFYVSMILLMVIVGVSIYLVTVGINAKYETEETKAFKEVLELLENNRGKSNKKSYSINFLEDFDYEEKIDNIDELVDYKAKYEAKGSFVLSYDKDDNKNVNIEKGFDSFIKYANGYMYGIQSEIVEISNEETDKRNNEKRSDTHKRGTDNKFLYDTDDSNVCVLSETKYEDYANSLNNTNDSFYGKINKNSLLEAIELNSLSKAINDLMFIDAWTSVNSLLLLMHNTFVNLNPHSYKGIYEYIQNKNFEFERKDNSIVIKFIVDLDSKLKENDNSLENIVITLEVDKNSGEINYFKFDLSNYLKSLLLEDAEGTTYFNSNVKNYYIDGKIINNTIARIDTSNISYKEYSSDEKFDFVDNFITKALPIREDIYQA